MSLLTDLIESILEAPGEFIDVALQGPVEGFLVLMGALLVGGPLIFSTFLLLGVVVDLITPESFGATHP